MNRTLLRISLRYLAGHRLQSLLLLLSVALGVAVIVAIDLANQSARRSFHMTAESLTGRATHEIVGGASGLDENLYRRLRVELGLEQCAPVVDGFVTVSDDAVAADKLVGHPTELLERQTLRVLGVDPFAEGLFRNYVVERDNSVPLETLRGFLSEPDSVLLAEDTARRLGLVAGGGLRVELGARVRQLHVAGLLKSSDEISRRALSGLLICDVATAQELFGQEGRLDRIDLILDENTPAGREELRRIRALLPPQARVDKPQTRTGTVEQLTRSFELNLSAVSLLTLIVGIFLVYNTVTFFVVQRRPLLGTLRTLGVTRQQIFSMVITETLVLGGLGAVLGLGLGVVLGQGAVHLVTRTINDLYFVLTATDNSVSPLSLLKGFSVGLVAAGLSALPAAWEAASVPPSTVLQRSTLESHARHAVAWLTAASVLFMAAGGLLLTAPGRRLDTAYGGLALLFLGAALAVPLATLLSMSVARPLLARAYGVCGSLAPRSIVRSLSRTAVAVAALMVAVSIIVGIQIMIGSFRQTVVDWLSDTLTADIFVRSTSSTFSISDAFEPQVAEEMAAFPGIREVHTARGVRIDTPAYGILFLLALSGDVAAHRRFVWADGSRDAVWQEVSHGSVLISEPFAYRYSIPAAPNQDIVLPTERGPQRFAVAGIFFDYGTERGAVIMAEDTYRRCWRERGLTSVAAYVAPGQDVEEVVRRLQTRFADQHRSLQVQSNRTLREAALTVFERTFTITAALRFLVGIVAFIGMLSTLMALQLERTREVGTLRALGMTVGQLWRMVLLETGLLGLLSGLFALPMGTALAWSLVYVINPRSFGWTIAFLPRAQYFVEAVACGLLAGLLAGVYPAYRFSQLNVAAALREE